MDDAAALQLWQAIFVRTPDSVHALVGMGTALCKLARYEEADSLLSPAVGRLPEQEGLIACFCRVAEARGDWPEAAKRWRVYSTRLPGRMNGQIGYARALLEQRLIPEAEAQSAEIMAQFPDNLAAYTIHARCANLRYDYAEAAKRWSSIEKRFPEHEAAAGWRKFSADRARLVSDEDDFSIADGRPTLR